VSNAAGTLSDGARRRLDRHGSARRSATFRHRVPAVAALVVVSLARAGWGFSAGPPEGFTGAPGGESTCAACHGNLDTGGGSLRLLAPQQYAPGDTLDLRVALQQVGQKRWGFELTAVTATAAPGGRIVRTDFVRTNLTSIRSRQYLKQTAVGTDNGVLDVAPGWSFRWVAPPTGTGPITFYATGNAADGDGTHLGDFIYKITWTIDELTSDIAAKTWSGFKRFYRPAP
jgi:hypothetical protein